MSENSFVMWLYDQLCEDDVISAGEWNPEDLTETDLLECTALEEADLENYRTMYTELCESISVEPVWDLE